MTEDYYIKLKSIAIIFKGQKIVKHEKYVLLPLFLLLALINSYVHR